MKLLNYDGIRLRNTYRSIATEAVATCLARRQPGRQVLVSNPAWTTWPKITNSCWLSRDLSAMTSSPNVFSTFSIAIRCPSYSGNKSLGNAESSISEPDWCECQSFDFVFFFSGGDYAKVAPHNSFIDALQMSPKALANYLLKLDRNDRSYYRHFWWKGFYEVFETSLPFHLVLLSR